MSSIEEKRQQLIQAKLKEMGDYGVKHRTAEESPFFDQPIVLQDEDEPKDDDKEKPIAPKKESAKRASSKELSFPQYQERYLTPRNDVAGGKSGFTINANLLQLLRDVLRDTRSKATLTTYIENILLEHLRTHQDLLNKTADQYRRKQTLNL